MAAPRAQGLVLQRDDHRGQAVLDFTLDDVAYLAGPGREALAEVAGRSLTDANRVADIAWARSRFGDRAAVLVETVLLRRRAAVKIDGAADWLFTDDALQQ
ncbi:MAG: class I SAM-dependent methyltransferase, partial [Mycobacterium sp.]